MSHRSKIALHIGLALLGGIVVKLVWEYLDRRISWWPHGNSGDVLAIIAIAFAVVQFLDARDEEKAMKKQEGVLDEQQEALGKQEARLTDLTNKFEVQTAEMHSIALSMSTRFAGPFPENLKAIVEVIGSATRHLKVIVDFPGYGQYSSPGAHLAYKQEFERARARDAEVRIICYNERISNVDRIEQFPDDPQRFEERNVERFAEYFRIRRLKPSPSFAGLRYLLKEYDEEMIRHLKGQGASWKFHEEKAAFFLWLRDDTEAIFTFKNVGRKDVGLSFRTLDANLIRQFVDIFDRRWDRASDVYEDKDVQNLLPKST